MVKTFLVICFSLLLFGCEPDTPEITRIQARVVQPTIITEPGAHPLGLGGRRLVNGRLFWKDGTLYIPGGTASHEPIPLLVWLHGGGGKAGAFKYLFPLAEEFEFLLIVFR